MKPISKKSSSNPFEALMEAAVDAMIVIDETRAILRFNRAAQKMFGYSADAVRGKNVNMLMPLPHRTRHDEYVQNYMETGIAKIIGTGREVHGLKSDGTLFPMLLSVGEIALEQGGCQFVGIIRDLTQQQATQDQVHQLEEQLLHADRLVILGELTAGIAHEINQPLTAIAAYADAGKHLIDRSTDQVNPDIKNICEKVAEQARRAAEVVQRLQKLVRTGTVSKAKHDLNQIISNMLLLFEYELNKSNITLQFYPVKGLQQLYLDEIQIQQILVNLVKNSMDSISAAMQQKGRIEIRASIIGREVEIGVYDNGPGVPQRLRPRIFESFFTSKPKGVGLGLSICKGIAAAHGGSLSFISPEEGGSCFTLKLPLEHIG